MNKRIDETLNLTPLDEIDETDQHYEVVEYEEKNVPAKKEEKSERDRDLEFARENLYGLISHGSDALETLKEIAEQSQHPRAYEVFSTMIKTLLDANKSLIETTEIKNYQETKEPEEKGGTTNNNLILGSTSDALELLKEMRNKQKDE